MLNDTRIVYAIAVLVLAVLAYLLLSPAVALVDEKVDAQYAKETSNNAWLKWEVIEDADTGQRVLVVMSGVRGTKTLNMAVRDMRDAPTRKGGE